MPLCHPEVTVQRLVRPGQGGWPAEALVVCILRPRVATGVRNCVTYFLPQAADTSVEQLRQFGDVHCIMSPKENAVAAAKCWPHSLASLSATLLAKLCAINC